MHNGRALTVWPGRRDAADREMAACAADAAAKVAAEQQEAQVRVAALIAIALLYGTAIALAGILDWVRS